MTPSRLAALTVLGTPTGPDLHALMRARGPGLCWDTPLTCGSLLKGAPPTHAAFAVTAHATTALPDVYAEQRTLAAFQPSS